MQFSYSVFDVLKGALVQEPFVLKDPGEIESFRKKCLMVSRIIKIKQGDKSIINIYT